MTIVEARRLVGQQIGLRGFDGSIAAFSDLSQADQERIAVALTAYILQHPDSFTGDQLAAARIAAGKVNFGRLGDYAKGSFLDQSVEFLKAYVSTAGEFIEGTAGVAGRSLSALGINLGVFVTVAAVAAIIYFGAPIVAPKLKAAFAKPPAP